MSARLMALAMVAASCGGPAEASPAPRSAPPGGPITFTGTWSPGINALIFTDGGTRLVGSGDSHLIEIDVAARRELGRIRLDSPSVPNPHARVGFGGTLHASLTSPLWAWDPRAGELLGVAMLSGEWGVGPHGVHVWRPASGTAAIPIRGRLGATCEPLAFSPDRTRVALRVNARQDGWCDDANSVQVFDVATQRSVAPPVEVGRTSVASFSSDGQRLAIGADRAHIYDLQTRVLLTAPTSNRIAAIAFQPGSPRVVWRTGHGEIESWQPGDPANADLGEGSDLAFSPDGRRLAVARRGAIELLDTTAFTPTGITLPMERGETLVFSDDGRQLAATTSRQVQVWQLEPVSAPAVAASGWFARVRPLPVPDPPPLPPFTRDGAVEGRVLLDGKPVVGAELVLSPSRQEYPDAVKLPPVKARTGAGGRFRFARVATIDWQLSVTARGTLNGHRSIELRKGPAPRADIELKPAATVVGRVLGPDKRPARGVRLYRASDYGGGELDLAAAADGSFTIDHLQPGGSLRFTATRRDGAVRTTTVALPTPGIQRVTIVLAARDDPHVVRGTVVDAAGKPVAGIEVSINQSYTVKTDARGAFSGDVAGKFIDVRVRGTRMGSDQQTVELPLKKPLKLIAKPY